MNDVDISQAAFMWHRSHEPFHKDSTDIPLVFRIATVADVKDPTAKTRSRYLWKTPEELQRSRNRDPSTKEFEPGSKRNRVDAEGDVIMTEVR